MKKAILFFYTAAFGDKIHPFLIDEVELLSRNFDEVHVVCLDTGCGYEQLSDIDNLSIHSIKRSKRYTSVGSLLKVMLRKEFLREQFQSLRDGAFSFKFLKEEIRVALPGQLMYELVRKIPKDSGRDTVIDSYWYDASAYAAARLKEKYPCAKAITRAHGIEIDPIRNVYTSYELKDFVYNTLNSICFISEAGKDTFMRTTGKKYNALSSEKLKVFRLGVNKKAIDSLKIVTKNGAFHIVSCSRIESVKRIPLLARALSHVKDEKILWTHLGDGSEMNLVKEIVEQFPENIEAEFLGNCDNQTVHNYYANNKIDLFVNVSSSEGIPVSIMEAFVYSIPCMATNVGGTSELIQDGSGVLFDPELDEYALAGEIKNFINMPAEIRIDMGKCAYKVWKEKFNKDSNANAFVCFLKSDDNN